MNDESGPAIKVIVINPNEEPSAKTIEQDLDTLQGLVGGYVQTIPFGTQATALINEDGKAEGLPRNQLATTLLHAMSGLFPGDYIVGTMVIVGKSDGDYFTDVPPEVVERLNSHENG